jgi:hypothetical protein
VPGTSARWGFVLEKGTQVVIGALFGAQRYGASRRY